MPTPTAPLRIAVIANKTWECEPLVAVLTSKDGRPAAVAASRPGFVPGEVPPATDPMTGATPVLPQQALGQPLRGNIPPRPRLSFPITGWPGALVEVWCIEDWMRTQRMLTDGTLAPVSGSSSREKFDVALPAIRSEAFGRQGADLIVAFGTAGIPAEDTHNGCVVVGTRCYLNDPWDDAPKPEIDAQEARFGPLLQEPLTGWLRRRLDCPRLSAGLFGDITMEARYAAEARFIEAPVHPARPPRILAGHGFASLGTINIADYDDYVWADEETHRRFELQIKQREVGSQETTHGLIRLTWHDTPFVYVSAVTDRIPWFNSEVTPRKYSQNFVAAHNGACAVAQLLPEFSRLHAAGKLFDMEKPTISSEGVALPPVRWPDRATPQPRPRYDEGETALDVPWGDIARAVLAAPPADRAGVLRHRVPALFKAIDADRADANLQACWGSCLNVDETMFAAVVDPSILRAIGASTEQEGVSHAGLAHTYGYLFSLLRTTFGYKRQRWVNPGIEMGFGLPRGSLGPNPAKGTLLANVTWLAGQIALSEERGRERLTGVAGRVSADVRAFVLVPSERRRVTEEVLGVADENPVCLRTDLVAFRHPGVDTHLLVYSVDDPRCPAGPQLITTFPVGAATAATLTAAGTSGVGREVRTRYNAFVAGLTLLGSRSERAGDSR